MHLFRSLARPLSLVALLALLAPAWVECRPAVRAAMHDGMSCCLKTGSTQGMLDSGCCTVRRAPESQQVPATTVTTRTVSVSGEAPALTSVQIVNALSAAPRAIAPEFGPPGPPLYLRLSIIRR